MIIDGTKYPEGWIGWANEAVATAVPGAKDFLSYAHSKGITIFYITNRVAELKEATQNLKAVHKRCVKVLSKAQAAEQQYAVAAKAAEPDYPADRPPVKGRVLKKKKRVTRNELIDGTGTDTSSSGMRRGRRRPRRSAE